METHHVIFLANEGTDRLTNVIALCRTITVKLILAREVRISKTEMILKLRAMICPEPVLPLDTRLLG